MAYDQLAQLGLNQTEITVYLNILEHGKTTPARISRDTGIKRTTVYAAAQELAKLGIVEEDNTGKIKYFTSRSPAELRNLITQKQRELTRQSEIVDELVTKLELRPKSKTYSIPKVRLVEGSDIIDFLYKQAPVWIQSMKDIKQTTHWGFQDHSFVSAKAHRDWINWYWEQAEGTDLKLLTNDAQIEKQTMKKKQLPGRQMKFWKGDKFTASQWVIGEYVINLMTDQPKPYLVQIRDRVLADNLRNLYQKLW